MKKYKLKVDGKEFTTELISRSASGISFLVNGKEYQVQITPVFETSKSLGQQASPATAQTRLPTSPTSNQSKANGITAPMPGIVTAIKVKAGDTVKQNTAILVIEAMKMENNINSNRAGIIREVLVKEGQEVKNGQELVILD